MSVFGVSAEFSTGNSDQHSRGINSQMLFWKDDLFLLHESRGHDESAPLQHRNVQITTECAGKSEQFSLVHKDGKHSSQICAEIVQLLPGWCTVFCFLSSASGN